MFYQHDSVRERRAALLASPSSSLGRICVVSGAIVKPSRIRQLLLALAAVLPAMVSAAQPATPIKRYDWVIDGGVEFGWRLPASTTITKHQYRYKLVSQSNFSAGWSDLTLSQISCKREVGSRMTGADCANTGSATMHYWKTISVPNGGRYDIELRTVNNDGESGAMRFTVALAANPDAVVQFADPVFKARVKARILSRGSLANGSEITQIDMARMDWFDFRDPAADRTPATRIKSVEGLQYAVNLFQMNISFHSITEIPQVADLTDLKLISFQGSLLSDISYLRNLTNLERMFLNHGLTYPAPGFDPDDGVVRSMSALSRLTKLWQLYICDQRVPPQHLAPFVNLKELSYCRNNLRNISPLRNLTKMQTLYLFENNIADASSLASLTDLQLLHLHGNHLRDVSFLSTLHKARHIYLSDNPLDAGTCSDSAQTNRAGCADAGAVWTAGVVEALTPLVTGQCSVAGHATESACTGGSGVWTDGTLKLIDLRGDTQLSDQDIAALEALTPSPTVLWDGDIRPAKPLGLAAAGSSGRMTLNWSNPNDDDIVAYQYRYRTGDRWSDWTMPVEESDSAFHDWIRDSADRTTLTMTGLDDGDYDFELRALVASDYSNARTYDDDAKTTTSALKVWQTAASAAGVGAGRWQVGRVLTPGPAARVESVSLKTTAPQAVQALPDRVLDMAEAIEVDLQSVFTDADGELLTFTASALDPGVVVSISGTRLVVTGTAAGVARVEVVATDPAGLSATLRFSVSVGAVLSLAGDAEAAEGGTVRLRVELSQPQDVAKAFLWRILADANPATADANADDYGAASGEGAVTAGETWTEIAVPVSDDATIEPAREWFIVEIEPSGDDPAALGRSQARVAVLEGVCDRTPAVRDALSPGGCETPTPADLASVRALVLEDREIDSLLTDDLLGLTGLRWLDLRDNALETLPTGLLSSTPALRALLLGGNRLTRLEEDALAGLAKLNYLDLSANGLTALMPGQFAEQAALRRLRLDGNALNDLPDGLFSGIANLFLLRLEDNPGAPFALQLALRRTDAEPRMLGPATVQVTAPTGMPFAVEVELSATGGTLRAEGLPSTNGASSTSAVVSAGGTASAALTAEGPTEIGPMRVEMTLPSVPSIICNGMPCWRGLELTAGEPLVLFLRPPIVSEISIQEVRSGEALRLPLDSLATARDAGELRWAVHSSDESVATVRLDGDELVVEPVFGVEGVVRIEAVATDADGQSATVTFDVHVEFFWPVRPVAGWRAVQALVPDEVPEEVLE